MASTGVVSGLHDGPVLADHRRLVSFGLIGRVMPPEAAGLVFFSLACCRLGCRRPPEPGLPYGSSQPLRPLEDDRR
jgi:hypothetical protein